MRAVIAAGGTAGHINPALAIANYICSVEPGSEIVFMGREDGMEKQLVEKAGYHLVPVETHGFMRSFKPEDILHNLNAVRCAVTAQIKAGRFFKVFKPDAVIGCGGYVSGPVVMKAAKMGIFTAIQEQNSFPGVTTRLLSKRVDRIFAANEEAKDRIGHPEKTIVSGNPIREGFFTADRETLRRKWGMGDRTCIISFGGSLGARTINTVSAHLMARHAGHKDIYHIHATGQYGTESFPEMLKELGVDENSENIRIETFISDMPECFAAADLIISRSGAVTISEISAAGRASVLIPSPNVTENHQYFNAMTLANAGAALVFEEKNLDAEKVADAIMEIAKDKNRLRLMGLGARSIAVPDSVKRIYDNIRRSLDGGVDYANEENN